MIEPVNRLNLEERSKGDQIWVVGLIAPFARAENKQREIMIADLISSPLKGRISISTILIPIRSNERSRLSRRTLAKNSRRLLKLQRQG